MKVYSIVVALMIVFGATAASAQTTLATYRPIDTEGRVRWTVDGTIGPRSLFVVGSIADAWQTSWNVPEEWGRSWSGVGKRYLEREADVAISNSMEAGLGALWGEEPRYIRAGTGPLKSRIGYAFKTVFLAQRPDGRLQPAWARVAANTVNNVIENAWLPPSITTPGQTAFRSVSGFGGRLAGNLWEEFWPDVKQRLRR
jgi:hypothetical protein